MDKKAGLLKIFAVLFLILLILFLAAGVYFYYVYVFKTLRFCVTTNAEDSNVSCSSDEFCREFMMNNAPNFKEDIKSAPEFAKEKINEILDAAIFCEETCKINEVRGFEDDLGNINSCTINEKEILLEIHGKESLAFIKYLKKQES